MVVLVALVALSACAQETGHRQAAEPHPSMSGVPCVLPPSGAPSPGPVTGKASDQAPDLALACFGGGGEVRLSRLGRPAVVNLWATWCEPCHRELPALVSYAQRGTVLVIGVATQERGRSATRSTIDDLGITFPTLYDPEGDLLLAIGRRALPVTLFITAGGTIAYTHAATALDTAGFERFARQYLGVA